MKQLFYISLLFTIPASANYCIQAVTLDKFNPYTMNSHLSDVLDNFKNARIEERGKYLVLRVGDFNSLAHAQNDIKNIKKIYPDAYIRKCNIDISKTIYPPDFDIQLK